MPGCDASKMVRPQVLAAPERFEVLNTNPPLASDSIGGETLLGDRLVDRVPIGDGAPLHDVRDFKVGIFHKRPFNSERPV